MKKELFKILYHNAKEIREWALSQKSSPNDLMGWCAICSYEIFKSLKEKNLKPKFVIVSSNEYEGEHCFVICKEYLIDVTATQFGMSKDVYVEKLSDLEYKWFWDYVDAKSLKNENDIFEVLEMWPSNQNPFKKEYENSSYTLV